MYLVESLTVEERHHSTSNLYLLQIYLYNIAFIGPKASGKTYLCRLFAGEHLPNTYIPTEAIHQIEYPSNRYTLYDFPGGIPDRKYLQKIDVIVFVHRSDIDIDTYSSILENISAFSFIFKNDPLKNPPLRSTVCQLLMRRIEKCIEQKWINKLLVYIGPCILSLLLICIGIFKYYL